MNSIQIIGALRFATGKQVAEVAKQHNYSKHTFYRVIKGESQTARVQEIIAEITGKPIAELWPDQDATRDAA